MPFNHGSINSFCSPISTLAFRMIFERPGLTSVLLPEKVLQEIKGAATGPVRFTIEIVSIWLHLFSVLMDFLFESWGLSCFSS